MNDEEYYTEHFRRRFEESPECEVCESKIVSEEVAEGVEEYLDVPDDRWTTYRVEEHHTQYEPEETITVCQRCHIEIHNTEKHAELRPPDEEAISPPGGDGGASKPEVCLAYLALNPDSTTTDVAKAVFSPDNTKETRNSDRKVRYYFEEKFSHLIEVDDAEGTNRYSVDDDSVWFGAGRVEMDTREEGETVSVGLGDTLMYIDVDGKPVITPLSASA